MGGGIAQLAAMKGLDVILCDMHKAALERSIATTNRSLGKLVQKQQLTQEQADSASSRITRGTDMQVQCHRASLYCPATCSALSHCMQFPTTPKRWVMVPTAKVTWLMECCTWQQLVLCCRS